MKKLILAVENVTNCETINTMNKERLKVIFQKFEGLINFFWRTKENNYSNLKD